MFNNFFFQNRATYEKRMCKNIVEPGMSQTKTWCMRITCWILKATHKLRICNIYCFSTAKMVARTRLNVTLHVYCLSCFTLSHIRYDFFLKKEPYWTQNVCWFSLQHLFETWFSLQLLFEKFPILRRIERDMIKNVYWSSFKVLFIRDRY